MVSYVQLQEFYVNYFKQAQRWLNWPERMTARLYFLDDRGKRRLHEPMTVSVTKTAADLLFNQGSDKHFPTEDFALRAAERGFKDGLNKLIERLEIVEADKQKGIRSDNSLGLIKIDLSLIRSLHGSGLRTVRDVKLAADDQLLAIQGIAKRRLIGIRSVMPHTSARLDSRRAMLASGQASLF